MIRTKLSFTCVLHCYLRMNIISFRGEIMTRILDVNQTIYELCNQYPEIMSIMIEIGFENITKPGMLQTAGRVMTLPKGDPDERNTFRYRKRSISK